MSDDNDDRDWDMIDAFRKETTDALNDHSGGCIDKMVNAFSKYGFNVQHSVNEDGTSSAYINGDEGIPAIFSKAKKGARLSKKESDELTDMVLKMYGRRR